MSGPGTLSCTHIFNFQSTTFPTVEISVILMAMGGYPNNQTFDTEPVEEWGGWFLGDNIILSSPAHSLNKSIYNCFMVCLWLCKAPSTIVIQIEGCQSSVCSGWVKESLEIIDNALEWISTAIFPARNSQVDHGQALGIYSWEIATDGRGLDLPNNCLVWILTPPERLAKEGMPFVIPIIWVFGKLTHKIGFRLPQGGHMAVRTEEWYCVIMDDLRDRKFHTSTANSTGAGMAVHTVAAKSTHAAQLQRGYVPSVF